jgi:transposase
MIYSTGIDLAKATITVTLMRSVREAPLVYGKTLPNTPEGFGALLEMIGAHTAPADCVFVTENTGVYGERLYFWLHRQGLRVTMEPAHYIRRAFRLKKKTDPVDSLMIAEYGLRYADQLHFWQPPQPVVEQVRILLVNRAQVQKMRTASKNIVAALGHKEHEYTHTHADMIAYLDQQETLLEQALKTELRKDQVISQHTTNLLSVPGVGVNFCANFLVITEGFQYVDYRNLAGYLGICPQPDESGASVHHRPRSDKKGPKRMRKQLYMSVTAALKSKKSHFRDYYERQTAKGKPGGVVMNNLENKLLRMACAIILTNRPYDKDYKSIRKKP